MITLNPVGALGVPAGCVSVTARPAIVAVALRGTVPVFAATENVTAPLPLPAAPAVMFSHADPSDADHVQPPGAVTENVTGPPVRATACATGDTEYVHGAPAWVTPRASPAIVIVALRLAVVPFAATVNATVPLPLPLAPLVIAIHDAVSEAVHPHPAGAVTENVLAAPDAPIDRLDGDAPYVHVSANEKLFDGVLDADPVAPTAAIRASYVVPAAGKGVRIAGSARRILPVAPGDGLPRETTRKGVDPPAA